MITGTHSCTFSQRIGDWKVSVEDLIFDLRCLNDVVDHLQCKTISYADIGYKYLHTPYTKQKSERYQACDVTFPGIVVHRAQNPYNREYRLIDGAHRVIKTITESGLTAGKFYVMSDQLFYDLITKQYSYVTDLGRYKCVLL